MTAGNTLPTSQPGQRALRLVAPKGGTVPAAPPASSAAPSPVLLRLQRDLEAARAEARSLHELLEELPAILERKFQLRLAALQAEQRRLEEGNALLQYHLLAGYRSHDQPLLKPSALPTGGEDGGLTPPEPPITQGLGLRRALRHLHR